MIISKIKFGRFLRGVLTPFLVSVSCLVGDKSKAIELENTQPGNAVRGEMIVRDISKVTCLICHEFPNIDAPNQGLIGPSLAGIGDKMTAAQLRRRVANSQSINSTTVMPPYFRKDGLYRVSQEYVGTTIYTVQQLEDVVAYLSSLTNE